MGRMAGGMGNAGMRMMDWGWMSIFSGGMGFRDRDGG